MTTVATTEPTIQATTTHVTPTLAETMTSIAFRTTLATTTRSTRSQKKKLHTRIITLLHYERLSNSKAAYQDD